MCGQYSPEHLKADGLTAVESYSVYDPPPALKTVLRLLCFDEVALNMLNRSKNYLLGKVFVDTTQVQYVAHR
ncbi:hypothetical protein ADP71_15540 [Vitreoscilla sp. C1]|uniref:hypothetical protein n=1 Tax=Vitreoscilla sp. (strain C1) TaxID=96942 RepID=UPI000CDCCBE5|nr:hypothetical protein [Vitreoscilla sp. C1]AUZ05130.1 hypothetical protein ADP71_15540 [Vitreoscilla sp. C1]